MELSPDFIEHIHDVLVGIFLPFDESLNPAEHRDRALIESAAARPFHTVSGVDLMPTLPEKAAALFHSLACNHCFFNGNKRTAVIALDIFLTLNGYLLTMTSDEVYELARATVVANMAGRSTKSVLDELSQKIHAASFSFELFNDPGIRERLGGNYETIALHVVRLAEFTIRMVKERPTKRIR